MKKTIILLAMAAVVLSGCSNPEKEAKNLAIEYANIINVKAPYINDYDELVQLRNTAAASVKPQVDQARSQYADRADKQARFDHVFDSISMALTPEFRAKLDDLEKQKSERQTREAMALVRRIYDSRRDISKEDMSRSLFEAKMGYRNSEVGKPYLMKNTALENQGSGAFFLGHTISILGVQREGNMLVVRAKETVRYDFEGDRGTCANSDDWYLVIEDNQLKVDDLVRNGRSVKNELKRNSFYFFYS